MRVKPSPSASTVDQREVGRAAADVEHQHALAGRQALLPRRGAVDPRVERGLRLLEQHDRRIAGLRGGLQRQLARGLVERRRHGDDHLLLGERRVGVRVVPRLADVAEHRAPARRPATAWGRRSRPTAGSRALRSTPGWHSHDFADAIIRDAMRAPWLRASSPTTDAAAGASGCPRQRGLVRREVDLAREVDERRQLAARRDLARRDELRDLEHADARIGGAGVDVRDRGVGGAEVDADQEARGHGYSRSRTEYSSFQRPRPSRATHHSSSVPTSVTCASRRTGTRSPALRSPSAGDQLLDRIELGEPGRVGLDQRAGRVVLARRGREEAERRRSRRRPGPSSSSGSSTVEPFLQPLRRDAQRLDRRREARESPASRSRSRRSTRAPCRRGCARPCRGGPGRSTPRRARPRDRGPRRRARATSVPAHAREQLDDPRAAACVAFITPPLNSTAVGIAAEPAEELGEVAGDRRIVRRRAGPSRGGRRRGASARSRRRRTVGKKPSTSIASACSRVSSALHRAADQLASRARGSRSAPTSARSSPSSTLLRAAARVDERALLHRIERLARIGELLARDRGEREVHVVAAEQDVIADRDPLEREVAVVARDLDQREVGGAAADVAHEHDVARRRGPCATPRRARRGTRRTRPAAPRAA